MDEEVSNKVMSQYINALANVQQQNFTLQAQLDIANQRIAELTAAAEDANTEA